jgi:hypothetical protein
MLLHCITVTQIFSCQDGPARGRPVSLSLGPSVSLGPTPPPRSCQKLEMSSLWPLIFGESRTKTPPRDDLQPASSFPSVVPPPTSQSKPRDVDSVTGDDGEIFSIVDEAGEGWGFDLDPATVVRPLAITSVMLFSLGMLAGIPAGITLGRSEEASSATPNMGKNIKPTASCVWLAFRAFAYGTILCGACGAAATYATANYYDAWTWDEFGRVMRDVVPGKRETMEKSIAPWLEPVRVAAAGRLPGPVSHMKDRFCESRLGIYVRTRVENAAAAAVDDDVTNEDRGGPR